MEQQKTAHLISRKDFLRLRFIPEENSSELTTNRNIYESCNEPDVNASTCLQMALPPEFRSLYAAQSKFLGISDTNKNAQEVEQQMLKALWESK